MNRSGAGAVPVAIPDDGAMGEGACAEADGAVDPVSGAPTLPDEKAEAGGTTVVAPSSAPGSVDWGGGVKSGSGKRMLVASTMGSPPGVYGRERPASFCTK